MIWLVPWIFLAIYGLTGISIILWVGVRWLWRRLPDNPEVADRQRRMDRDRELVRLGKVPGYRQG
jgi:hypothetical protein